MVRAAGWRRGQVGGRQDRGGQRCHRPEVPQVQFDEVLLGHLISQQNAAALPIDSQAAERGKGDFD